MMLRKRYLTLSGCCLMGFEFGWGDATNLMYTTLSGSIVRISTKWKHRRTEGNALGIECKETALP
jgi:hypothetical protein